MNKLIYSGFNRTVRLLLLAAVALALTFGTGQLTAQAATYRSPVDLGMATHFVILTKTGITNVPTSAITGDLGTSPIASTAITGFSMYMDPSGTFSRSSQVVGKIYAANYKSPTPSNLTTAISNMQTAYVNAAGRTLPDHVNLGAGNISGMTLAPGLYKWGTGVIINNSVTLAGPANAVWIFQIAGNLTEGSGAKVVLSGGARSANVFWQVGGGIGVTINTTAHMEGTILAIKAIHLLTGASLNGRALAQTAVTLQKNKVVISPFMKAQSYTSNGGQDGWVLASSRTSGVGGSMNSTSGTFRVGQNAGQRQYRSILSFNTAGLPDNAIVTAVRLQIRQQSVVGNNPFATLGNIMVDIRSGAFSNNSALQISDFQAAASRNWVGSILNHPAGGWYTGGLGSTAFSYVNRTGLTQLRLRFGQTHNKYFVNDFLSFYSGNGATANAPRLTINYWVP